MSFKHGDHRHDTVAQARACESGEQTSAVMVAVDPSDSGEWGWADVHAAADGVVTVVTGEIVEESATQRLARQTSPFLKGDGATRKQLQYVVDLAARRGVVITVEDLKPLGWSKREASAKIDALRGSGPLPALPQSAAPVLEASPANLPARRSGVDRDGIYRNPATGEIYKVQWNRASGSGRNLYAKRMLLGAGWDDHGPVEATFIPLQGQRTEDYKHYINWEYVPGLIAKIHPEWRMTAEETTAFGALYGICARCGRDLTAEVSIDRGLGPICAGKQFGA